MWAPQVEKRPAFAVAVTVESRTVAAFAFWFRYGNLLRSMLVDVLILACLGLLTHPYCLARKKLVFRTWQALTSCTGVHLPLPHEEPKFSLTGA